MSMNGKSVNGTRLALAFVLAPIITVVWEGFSLDAVTAWFGGRADGPAGVMLGAFLIVVGFAVPFFFLLIIGLPYVLLMLRLRRLNFGTLLLPTVASSLIYGWVVYASLSPQRHPAPARMMGITAVAGVIVSGLCFYLVGVWKNGQKRQGAPAVPPAQV